MRTKELQIGDWASLHDTGEFYQVTEIDEEFIRLGYAHECYYKEVEPIPLTAEILEKNGFEIYKDTYNKIGYHYVEHKLVIFVHFNDKKTEVDIYSQNDSLNISTSDVYVHTLQHALRLCGIDKEIKL